LNRLTPAPFEESKPYAQLLIFFGLFGIAFFFLGIITLLLQQSGLVNLMLIQNPASYIDEDVVNDSRNYQLISDAIIFIFPVLVFSFLVSKKKLAYLQINKTGKFSLLILGALTIIVSTPLIDYMGVINQRMPLPESLQSLERMADDLEKGLMSHHTLKDLFLNLFIMAFMAGLAEELFFRAGLQKILVKLFKSTHAGIWIAAIIFSAIHMQFSGFFPRMFLGVFLGYLFVWSGSLWVNIFAHFVFNAAQIFVEYLQDTNSVPKVLDNIYSESPGPVYVIISAVLVVLLLVAIYRISGRKKAIETPTISSE
jgi:uncharacterized protein